MVTSKTSPKARFPDIELLREGAFSQQFSEPVYCAGSTSALCDYFYYYGFDVPARHASGGYSMGTLSYKSIKLVGHWWRVIGANSTIILAHGLFDHTGLYLKLVNDLLEDGFNVFAADMPGHGISEGPTADIEDFGEYAEVLELCTRQVLDHNLDENIYMIGQSTGGAAVMQYLTSGNSRAKVNRVVLLAPLLRPKKWWSVNVAYITLHKFISGIPRKFAVNSNDTAFLEFLANKDTLQPRMITMSWMGAMRNWLRAFPLLPKNTIPLLLIQGDDDGTVDWEYNLPQIQARFSNSQLLMLPGAKHHLVNETANYREKIEQAISVFLK